MIDRRTFIRNSALSVGAACVLPTIMSSCSSAKYVDARYSKTKILVAKSDFETSVKNKDGEVVRDAVLVDSQKHQFPIMVHKDENEDYLAVLLACTHRQCTLNVGTKNLTCACHGSEFTRAGDVLSPPADQPLKRFNVVVEKEYIVVYI